MKAESILDLIGNTPHLKIRKLFPGGDVWVKLERQNPGASIKDRIALSMIIGAEGRGELKQGMKIVEPTSGNTGIGLALVCAIKGYELTLVMPESMSVERRKIMQAYGAKLELTPKEKGMKGAIEKAREIKDSSKEFWMPMQFDNRDNLKVHAETTAQEILQDFPQGFDALITGVGTGGHLTAVGKILKEKFPNLKVIAVEPDDSPVLSGGNPGPHPIQGIGAGFVPSIVDRSVIDEVIRVTKNEAFDFARRGAREEGIFMGISSGASLAAVEKYLAQNSGKKILTFNYDTGERYLSVADLF